MVGRHRPSGVAPSPWWARLFVWFGAVLVFMSGGTLVGAQVVSWNLADSVGTDDLLGGARKSNSGRATLDGPLNILLLGTDRRKGWTSWQSDTIILVHVPKEHDRGYLISFQRDILVDIPPDEQAGFPGGQGKLNSAFAYGGRRPNEKFEVAGGFQLMAKTIMQMTDIPLNSGAAIDFKGFLNMVEVLGGVHMCVETPKGTKSFKSIHKPYRTFKKGCQELSAKEALDYSRQRKQFDAEPGGGDFARMRHQQQLIKAILKRALKKGFNDPSKIPSLVEAAGKSLVIDNSIALEDLAWTLRGISPDSLTALKVPVAPYDSPHDNISYQQLTPEAESLFQAIRDQKVDSWVARNMTFVNPM